MFGLLVAAAEAALREKHRAYKKRELNYYYPKYQEINAKYNLGIPDDVLYQKAERYAKLKADRAYPSIFGTIGAMFNEENIWKTLTNLLVGAVGIVLSVLLPPAGWMMATSATSSILALVTSLSLQAIDINLAQSLKLTSQEIAATNQATAHANNAIDLQNAQITKLLIYNPYAIFPEGEIYKSGRAGDITYQAGLEAPNPMRGINGQVKENPLGEQLSNRAHTKLAGNVNFDMLALPFPNATFKENSKLIIEGKKAGINYHATQVQNGFKELAENYFCFDDSATFDKHFNRNIATRVTPRIKDCNDYVFIWQNQYYKEGKRLPLFTRQNLPNELKSPKSPSYTAAPVMISHTCKYGVLNRLLKREYATAYMGMDAREACVYINTCEIFCKMASNKTYEKKEYYYNSKEAAWFQKVNALPYTDDWRSQDYPFILYNYSSREWEALAIMDNFLKSRLYTIFALGGSGEILLSTYAIEPDVSNYYNNPKVKESDKPQWHQAEIEPKGHFAILCARLKSGVDSAMREILPQWKAAIEEDRQEAFLQQLKAEENGENAGENPQSEASENNGFVHCASGLPRLASKARNDGNECPSTGKGGEAEFTSREASEIVATGKFFDYYDIECVGVIKEGKNIVQEAQKLQASYNIQGDNFIFYAINTPLLEEQQGDVQKVAIEAQKANQLYYELVLYMAEKQQEQEQEQEL